MKKGQSRTVKAKRGSVRINTSDNKRTQGRQKGYKVVKPKPEPKNRMITQDGHLLFNFGFFTG